MRYLDNNMQSNKKTCNPMTSSQENLEFWRKKPKSNYSNL